MQVNAQYNVAAPDSLPVKVAAHQRRKMFAAFLDAVTISEEDTVLDVGATNDQSYDHSNYFETWFPHKAQITAVGIDDASFLSKLHSGLSFVRADGRALPFASGSFDYVHSSAVLEHVGSREMQALFIRELWRVARKGVFATTPNRWFPIEFHTVLPLLHWLPPSLFRKTLTAMGRDFFAREENLNLLSPASLTDVAKAAGIENFRVGSVAIFGWPTNLLLVAKKSDPSVNA